MMRIEDILSIKEIDSLSKDNIAYLISFLGESTNRQSKHWLNCLNKLEAVVRDGGLLPVDTIKHLFTLLLNDTVLTIQEKGCDLLAYIASNGQSLPNSVLRALENMLATGPESHCAIAAAALCQAVKNGQILTDDIVKLAESAFIRHTNAREELGLF